MPNKCQQKYEIDSVKLTFPLNCLKQFDQNGWSNLWKGKLLRQVGQEET